MTGSVGPRAVTLFPNLLRDTHKVAGENPANLVSDETNVFHSVYILRYTANTQHPGRAIISRAPRSICAELLWAVGRESMLEPGLHLSTVEDRNTH